MRKNKYSISPKIPRTRENEKGSAILIALMIMILLLGFVALAITRTTNETVASSNDAAETRSFEAAQASLEVMTRNFDKIFDYKLNPDTNDLNRIQGQTPPGFDGYTFDQTIRQTQATTQVVMTGQQFQGLNAQRDKWEINAVATDQTNGVQVALRRDFFNNRIPIFQFGIFYEDDLEFHPGPRFDFGGRVHSNGHLFMMAETGLYFASKVTATGHVFTDVARNGYGWNHWGDNVHIKNASGKYVQLKHNMGSVLNGTPNGPRVTNPHLPAAYKNNNWHSHQNLFQGNLLSQQKPLDLPIRIASRISGNPLDYVELVKRGKAVGDLYNGGTGVVPVNNDTADTGVTSGERYYNKAGIRISLADSKAKLPGCASGSGQNPVAGACGIRLDGSNVGDGTEPSSGNARGYQPLAMGDGYQATEINGERFYTGRQVWIKVESVGFNPTNGAFETKDITADILSLGVTERAPIVSNTTGTYFAINYPRADTDTRSIIKLQRFIFGGSKVVSPDTAYMTSETLAGTDYNYVLAATTKTGENTDNGTVGSFGGDHSGHHKSAIVRTLVTDTFERKIVAFPINMFDTREGLYYEGTSVFNPTAAGNYGKNVPWAGVMSMVDIDVGNLKDFLDGDYNGKMPNGTPFANAEGHTLRSTDIPDANGWVLYVSDRRGDADFDGEYDMEDIYGNNDGILQPGEDINNDGTLQTDYWDEAAKYRGAGAHESPAIAATLEHRQYRRGIRLVNGQRLPGNFDATTPNNTKGFTVASENGVYVKGNYNAYGIASVGTPTPAGDYLPQNTPDHIPASIAADAITILSNNWSDARSFTYPFSLGNRDATETFIRFALLSGDTKTSLDGTPNQGGGDPRMAGGVHNFKRFLEDWSNVRLNYTGSLINLYNSHNNNGAFKCCAIVYSPPTRNWVFDASFLDPNRLPPGTPFFQSIQITGFQRVN